MRLANQIFKSVLSHIVKLSDLYWDVSSDSQIFYLYFKCHR